MFNLTTHLFAEYVFKTDKEIEMSLTDKTILEAVLKADFDVIFSNLIQNYTATNAQLAYLIKKLQNVACNIQNLLDDEYFIADNTVADYSYCDADTGYNSVNDIEMSDYYNSLSALVEKIENINVYA